MSAAGVVVAAVNAAWQTALLNALAGIALRVVRPSAAGHAAVWTAVFFTGAVLMPVDFVVQLAAAGHAQAPAATHAAVAVAQHNLPLPLDPRVVAVAGSVDAAPASLASTLTSAAARVAVPFIALWLLLAGCQLLRLWRAVGCIRELKRHAILLDDVPAAIGAMAHAVRGTRIAISTGVTIPCAVGFRRPMVLLPASLAGNLHHADLVATVAHEVAHLRRYDDVLQIAQQAVRAIFNCNPLLNVAGRRIDFYREAACDDHVISSRASALRYAECLATILERTIICRRSIAPALAHGPRQVTARVERLVNWKEGPRNMGRVALLLALAICATAMFFARVEIPMLFPHAAAHPSHDTVVVVAHSDDEDGSLLGALSAAGYRPTVDETIAISNAGVDTDLIVAVGHSGIERPSIHDLISMANAGVDADLLGAAVRVFGASVSPEDLIRLQNNGVDADDLAQLRSANTDMSVADLIALHNAGVDADYLRHLARVGHHHLSVTDVIRLHEAGVDT